MEDYVLLPDPANPRQISFVLFLSFVENETKSCTLPTTQRTINRAHLILPNTPLRLVILNCVIITKKHILHTKKYLFLLLSLVNIVGSVNTFSNSTFLKKIF